MNCRKALWESCILLLVLCAGWQALIAPKGIWPVPSGTRPHVQEAEHFLRSRQISQLRQKPDGGAARAGRLAVSFAKLPLSFEANQGQADESVKFLSHGRGYALFLTGDEAVLEVQESGVRNQEPGAGNQKSEIRNKNLAPLVGLQRTTNNGRRTTNPVLRLKLVNASQDVALSGARELPGKANYFLGNDPAKWRTNLPTYAQVRYRNVYPGIDLVYYGNQGGQLEYDFIIAPGADPGAIALAVNAAGQVGSRQKAVGSGQSRIDSKGDLVIASEDGELRFHKPVVYQPAVANGQLTTDHGPRTAVEGHYVLQADNQVHFALGPYDHTQPLVIDPSLIYSTYLGGVADQANGIAVDVSGNSYVAGRTLSAAFPFANPLQSTNKANDGTAFVSKLNPTGSALVYSTYLGGSGSDQANAIAVDPSGDAYVAGYTCSSDFPTVKPVQAGLKGACDGFVAELNAAGSGLVYSTYLGGSGTVVTGGTRTDEAWGIAADSSGAAYVTGGTWSTDFPTVNPLQSYGGGTDAFLCKFNPGGATLVYSTYLGGADFDQGNGIAVDSSGNAYVTGLTASNNFPTANPFQASNKAGGGTAFAVKVNPAGSALVYSTYLGGSTSDAGQAIAVDSAGDAYLAGVTWSSDFPTFIPLQPGNANKHGGSNVFVTKLNAAGSALLYSTYLGGSGHSTSPPGGGGDYAYGIAVDPLGVVFVAGLTGSTDFPTVNAIQSSNNSQDEATAFIACLDSAGTALGYSTYLGGTGTGYDQAYAIATDTSDNAYVAGFTSSPDFPTVSPLQAAPGGAFIAQISPPPAVTLFPTSLNFGTVPGNTMSQERIVTLSSINNSAVSIISITASGDFALETTATSCPYGGGTIPAGANCTINVTFTPTATGPRTGDLTINYDGAGSPLSVPLSGVGIVSAVNVAPVSLSFSGQDVGTQSPSQPVTLLNIGSVQLGVTSVAVSSGFKENNTCVPTIAAFASCTINVSFQPTVSGLQTGTLTITDLAGNSPQTVALSGTGVAPAVSLSNTVLTFPGQTVTTTSAPQTLTLTDAGTGPLTPLVISTSGDFAQTNTCSSSVASGANCTISVTFTPSATGNRSGTLTLTDNAGNSPQTVLLSGAGEDFALAPPTGSPSSATIVPGQTAKYLLVVNAVGGFNQAVALTCGGVPSEATCVTTPNTVTPGANFTLLVTTTAPSVTSPRTFRPPRLPGPLILLALAMFLACIAWTLLASRRTRAGWRKWSLPLAAGLLLALALAGCGRGGPAPGSNHGTPTGTYNLQVTGTFTSGSATVTRSVTLTLKVS